MKAKMNAMEDSLQRFSHKETQLLVAIEALHTVTTRQGKKLEAYKTKKEKLKAKIGERNVLIRKLKKERDDLKSTSEATQKEFQNMHDEITCLQNELLQTQEYAGKLESENRELSTRMKKLESRRRSEKGKKSYNALPRVSMSNSYVASKRATEELQAKIEQKLFGEMGLNGRAMQESSQQEPKRSI
uniref:Uncharacterized protein n=1 Tax=Helicotheca tamesis TaxID=374047 RepID=A0A7S2HE53_9STRA